MPLCHLLCACFYTPSSKVKLQICDVHLLDKPSWVSHVPELSSLLYKSVCAPQQIWVWTAACVYLDWISHNVVIACIQTIKVEVEIRASIFATWCLAWHYVRPVKMYKHLCTWYSWALPWDPFEIWLYVAPYFRSLPMSPWFLGFCSC